MDIAPRETADFLKGMYRREAESREHFGVKKQKKIPKQINFRQGTHRRHGYQSVPSLALIKMDTTG